MSHVDEGTLHAYLDGALSPPEAQGLEAHLAECPACGDRLTEERALRSRAAELLGRAVPPARALPPFRAGDTRAPVSRWWRARAPLAWAATVILALGIGVYLGSSDTYRRRSDLQPARLESQAGAVPARADLDHPAERAQQRARGVPPPSLARDGRARVVAEARPNAPAAARQAEPLAGITVTGQQAGAAPRPPAGAVTPAPLVIRPATEHAEADRVRALRLVDSLAVVPVPGPGPFTLDSARALLGRDPLVLPGLPIRAVRRAPGVGYAAAVVIEQDLDSGMVIELIERRRAELRLDTVGAGAAMLSPSAGVVAKPAREAEQRRAVPAPPRPVRFVDELEVTISGAALPWDSLTGLLQRVRPVGR